MVGRYSCRTREARGNPGFPASLRLRMRPHRARTGGAWPEAGRTEFRGVPGRMARYGGKVFLPDARSAGGLCQRLRIFWKVSGSGQSCREIWRAEANGPPRRCGKIPCPIMPRFARIIFRAVSGVLIIHGVRFAFAADGIRYIRKQWRNLFWTIRTGKAGTNSGRFRGVPLLGGARRGKNYREKSVTCRDNKGYSGNIRYGNCNAIAMKVRKGGEMKTGKGENVFDFIRAVHGKVAFSGLRKYLPEQTARRLAETAALDTVCAIWEHWNGIPVYISTDSRYRTFSVWWIARKTVAGGIKNLRDDSFLDFIRERSGEKFLEATREHLPEKKRRIWRPLSHMSRHGEYGKNSRITRFISPRVQNIAALQFPGVLRGAIIRNRCGDSVFPNSA